MDPIRSLEGDTLDMQQNFFEKDREGICCISRTKIIFESPFKDEMFCRYATNFLK